MGKISVRQKLKLDVIYDLGVIISSVCNNVWQLSIFVLFVGVMRVLVNNFNNCVFIGFLVLVCNRLSTYTRTENTIRQWP